MQKKINIPNMCATTLRKKGGLLKSCATTLCRTTKTIHEEKHYVHYAEKLNYYLKIGNTCSSSVMFPSCTAAPASRRPRRAGGTAATARLRAVEELRAVGEALYLIFVLFVARRGTFHEKGTLLKDTLPERHTTEGHTTERHTTERHTTESAVRCCASGTCPPG